jgi:hypothetical protein
MSDQGQDAVAFWILLATISQGSVGLAIFRFLAGFMLGEPIPLCGHPQQRLSLMPIVRFGGVTTTFLSTLSIIIRGRHARRVIRTD